MTTYNKKPLASVDVKRNTATGSLLTEDKSSDNYLACGQAKPAAGAAVALGAAAGVRKLVVTPLVNDDGTQANQSVVYLRPDATNAKTGIPILPTDGKVVLYVSDLTKVFVKTITGGDGINWAAFD